MERRSRQLYVALGRADQRDERFSLALGERERQYAGSPGPASYLRASRPPGVPHRARWPGRHVVDSFEGKRLNSPNDIVCKTDGSIWFTDPSFGILSHYEGEKAEPQLPTNVYRIDHQGSVRVVAEGISQPNGSAFSPDESLLYIVESRSVPRRILAYDVIGGVELSNRRILIDAGPKGTPDGFRVDLDGNLWVRLGHGRSRPGRRARVQSRRAPDRSHRPLERCANLCFGGVHRNRLFMAASTSLYSLYVNTQGVPYF